MASRCKTATMKGTTGRATLQIVVVSDVMIILLIVYITHDTLAGKDFDTDDNH